MRKTYKWYHKISFILLLVSMLSSHKIYKSRGGKIEFLQFVHDVLTSLVSNAPHLAADHRRHQDNLVRLTGRHFLSQSLYEGQAKDKKHKPKDCRVCRARGIKTAKGLPIRSMWQCGDCPGNPGLCPGDCFRVYHTKIDFYKV